MCEATNKPIDEKQVLPVNSVEPLTAYEKNLLQVATSKHGNLKKVRQAMNIKHNNTIYSAINGEYISYGTMVAIRTYLNANEDEIKESAISLA